MTTTETAIRRRVRRFELVALLHLLEDLGYGPEEIIFRSNHSIASQVSLIEDIRFNNGPPRVEVFVNYGLLSAQSPLPSYFQKKMDEGTIDGRAFHDFLEFFDHHVIEGYLHYIYPETNPRVFSNWEAVKRRFLTMLDLRSVATQQWLFDLVFPDLDVKVEKASLKRGLTNAPIVLGKTAIGSDAVFGGSSRVPIQGIRVTLSADYDHYLPGKPWPNEIKSRLAELVFPLLGYVGADLEVFLVIRTQRTFAKLHQESFLGYDKIQGGEDTYRRLRIFSGHLPE